MFYNFRQNNSGGVFGLPAINVIVEAGSAEEANSRAENEIGLYFDGYGDCSCCGDRWYTIDEYEAADSPSIYGKEVDFDDFESHWGSADNIPTIAIYYANGDVVTR